MAWSNAHAALIFYDSFEDAIVKTYTAGTYIEEDPPGNDNWQSKHRAQDEWPYLYNKVDDTWASHGEKSLHNHTMKTSHDGQEGAAKAKSRAEWQLTIGGSKYKFQRETKYYIGYVMRYSEAADRPAIWTVVQQLHPENDYSCRDNAMLFMYWFDTTSPIWNAASQTAACGSCPGNCPQNESADWSDSHTVSGIDPGEHHVVWIFTVDTDADQGYLRAYVDGVELTDLSRTNANFGYWGQANNLPYLHLGFYHYQWGIAGKRDSTDDVDKVWWDEFRLGDANSSYAQVAPHIPPATPVNTNFTPADGATNQGLNPTLDTSGYTYLDDTTTYPADAQNTFDHYRTNWQLLEDSDDDGDCTDETWAAGSDGWQESNLPLVDLENHTFSGLTEATRYCWRVRYASWAGDIDRDGDGTTAAGDTDDYYWSSFSTAIKFTTQGEGLPAGTHEGHDCCDNGCGTAGDDCTQLEDSDSGWGADNLIGYEVVNTSQSNNLCVVTDNTTTTVICTLSGGADWDIGDSYTLTDYPATHDGADAAATLRDLNAGWTPAAEEGKTVTNTTNGETCVVTDNDETTVTCTLSGGETWDYKDAYTLTVTPGAHETYANSAFLYDSDGLFDTTTVTTEGIGLVGCTVTNTTKSESCEITSNTATNIVCTLSGSADWDIGNTYTVTDCPDPPSETTGTITIGTSGGSATVGTSGGYIRVHP